MRDAAELKDITVEIDGKRGKIVGFWLTDDNVVYAKVKDSNNSTTNYRLTELNREIKVIKKKIEYVIHT